MELTHKCTRSLMKYRFPIQVRTNAHIYISVSWWTHKLSKNFACDIFWLSCCYQTVSLLLSLSIAFFSPLYNANQFNMNWIIFANFKRLSANQINFKCVENITTHALFFCKFYIKKWSKTLIVLNKMSIQSTTIQFDIKSMDDNSFHWSRFFLFIFIRLSRFIQTMAF